MTFRLFLTTILFLLFVFQALQVYFFKRKQMLYGGIFVVFFWSTLGFLLYNFNILFSTNTSVGGTLQPKSIIIQRGATLSEIADQLFNERIIKDKNHFLWTANLMGLETRLQAGEFNVAPYMSNFTLIRHLASGTPVQERVTIIEGITARDIASLLSQKLDINSIRFLHIVNDSSIAEKLGIDAPSLEGYLFPETYHFNRGVSEVEVIEILVAEFKKNVSDSLLVAAKNHDMTLHELVILASIIEGEAVVDDERPLISAVYHNRLKKNWRLEADPTVQYIIPDGPRRLLSKDLEIDSPYNTYKYKGLPPGPINNPGLKSLLAAAAPASEQYLYFVATGEGRHYFSRTHEEHLRAKKKLDQLRRNIRLKSNSK